MKPKDLLGLAKDRGAVMVDLKFMDFLGLWQHFTDPDRASSRGGLRGGPRLRRLVDPRLGGDQRLRHAGDAGPDHGGDGSVHEGPDAVAHLQHRRPDHQGSLQPRPAQHRAARRRSTSSRPASPTPRTSGPRPSSSSSTRSASTAAEPRLLRDRLRSRAAWNTGREEQGGNLGYKPRYKEGYFPVAPDRQPAGHPRPRCAAMLADVGIQVERQHHEVATAGQARSTCGSTRW